MVACAHDAPRSPSPPQDTIELVESEPAGTSLDLVDVPDAYVVWPRMLDAARRTIDLEEFYASSAPEGPDFLEPSLAALERAITRGVRVRIVLDATFHEKYPDVPARLARAGAAVHETERFKKVGGVQHAKFFVIDREDAYLGSQNFDYRSLEHIQELGVRIRSAAIASALDAIFESDFDERPPSGPARTIDALWSGEPIRATPVFSPRGWIPSESTWDLFRLVSAIDGARKDLRVQVLTYDARSRDGSPFRTLDDALRRAAARGVQVRMIVSEWSRRHATALSELSTVASIKVVTIPAIPGRDIPFARVVHAKYMVADDRVAWIGTSNWEGDYFEKSRNVGLVLEGAAPARELAAFFDRNWSSEYAAAF